MRLRRRRRRRRGVLRRGGGQRRRDRHSPLATEDDVDATLDLYRELADLAPLAIEEEWRDLLVLVETTSTVAPDDPESVQRAVAVAFATERSAVAVRNWILANCGVDIGPVATIAPQDPAATTTLPPRRLDVDRHRRTTPTTLAPAVPTTTPPVEVPPATDDGRLTRG